MNPADIDRVLEKLVKEVQSALHAQYRGESGADTARAATLAAVAEAGARVAALAASGAAQSTPTPAPRTSSPRPAVSAPMIAGAAFGWTDVDSDAVLKCVTSWLPVSGPAATAPDSKCIAPGRMLIPTWGERERAREALRRITEG